MTIRRAAPLPQQPAVPVAYAHAARLQPAAGRGVARPWLPGLLAGLSRDAVEPGHRGDPHRRAGGAGRRDPPGRRPAAGEIERCGYVERRPAPDDARATVVHFTPRGRRLLATVFSLVEEQERSFAEVLGPADYEAVRAGLARLADAIDAGGAFGVGDEGSAAAPAPPVTAPARRRR